MFEIHFLFYIVLILLNLSKYLYIDKLNIINQKKKKKYYYENSKHFK